MRPVSVASPLVVVDFDDSKASLMRGFLHISVTPPLPTKAKPSREPFCRGIFPTSGPNPLRHLDAHVVKVASKLKMRKQSDWRGGAPSEMMRALRGHDAPAA